MVRLGIKKIFLVFFCVAFLAYPAYAAVIGVSPSILHFNKMLKGGYAQATLIVTTSTQYTISAHFTKEGDIKDWISFEPAGEKFDFSYALPYSFTLVIEPPADAKNGNYTGILKVTTDELSTVLEGAGSSVIAQIAIPIYIEIVGEEVVLCRAGAISVTNSETGKPFSVRTTVYNDGNVRLRPQVKVDVYDKYMTKVVFSNSFLGEQILPTRSKEIVKEIDNDLAIDQYFADLFILECGVRKQVSFDVVEKGGIADSGDLIAIRTNEIIRANEPTPIVPVFHNTGSRAVLAQFKGEVRNLDTDKIAQVLESDRLEILPGESSEFVLYFTPKTPANYQITGRVTYNNKITYNEESRIIKVIDEAPFRFSWIFYIIIYLIIGLVILILIGKIRKAQRKKRR